MRARIVARGRRAAAVLGALALAAGCTGGSDDEPGGLASLLTTTTAHDARVGEEEDGGDDEHATEPTDGVTSWVGDHLPPVASVVTVVDDVGVYFGVVEDRYELVAIDVATGEQRWRRAADQHGRIPGVMQRPTVDPATGVVYAPTITLGLPTLAAVDLRSGEDLWEAPTALAETSPMLCGERALCVTDAYGGGIQVHDRRTGAMLTVVEAGLPRTVGLEAGLRLSADPEGGAIELGEISEKGYEQRWRLQVDELVPPELVGVFRSDGGWWAHIVPSTETAVVTIAAWGGDDVDDPRWAEAAATGWFAAVVTGGGQVVYTTTGVVPCHEWDDTSFVLCSGLGVDRLLDVDEDGSLDPTTTATRVSRHSVVDGRVEATVDLPAPVVPYTQALSPTSDPDTVLVRAGGDSFVADLTTGRVLPPEESSELLVPCPFPGIGRRVTLETSWGAREDYLAPAGLIAAELCRLGGGEVPAASLLREGETVPEWIRVDLTAPAALGPEPPPAPDHALWVDVEGTLHGLVRR